MARVHHGSRPAPAARRLCPERDDGDFVRHAIQLSDFATSLASYYDTLADDAFGNFRDLLKAATLHPTMGYWLNMQGNPKGNLATGLHPNENYAREIMQLFSIGLNRHVARRLARAGFAGQPGADLQPGHHHNGFARVFTGWNWHQAAPGQRPAADEFRSGDRIGSTR